MSEDEKSIPLLEIDPLKRSMTIDLLRTPESERQQITLSTGSSHKKINTMSRNIINFASAFSYEKMLPPNTNVGNNRFSSPLDDKLEPITIDRSYSDNTGNKNNRTSEKNMTPNQQTPNSQGANTLLSNQKAKLKKPNQCVLYLVDRFYEFEQRAGVMTGFYFTTLVVVIMTTFLEVKSQLMPEMPIIQYLYVILTISFLLNYYSVRSGHILPYLEIKEDDNKARLACIFGFLSIILILFAKKYTDNPLVDAIWFNSWVFAMILEKVLLVEEGFSKCEFVFALLTLFGNLLSVSPEVLSKNSDQNFKNLGIGTFILACLASFCTAAMCVILRKIAYSNMFTISHYLGFVFLFFLPFFLPMQTMFKPSQGNWLFMIIAGCAVFFLKIVFIRGIQLERPSLILILINLAFVVKAVTDLFLGHFHKIMFFVGSTFILIGCSYLGNENSKKVFRGSFRELDEEKGKEMQEVKK